MKTRLFFLFFLLLLVPIALNAQTQSFGYTQTLSASFTRPANATPYTAGDIIGPDTAGVTPTAKSPLLRLGPLRSKKARGYITNVTFAGDSLYTSGVVGVIFYSDSTGLTRVFDNATFPAVYTSKMLGPPVPIAFTGTGMGTGSTVSIAEAANLVKPFVCTFTTEYVFARVVCITAFTPKQAGIFYLTTTFEIN